jgi:hypothetical protein
VLAKLRTRTPGQNQQATVVDHAREGARPRRLVVGETLADAEPARYIEGLATTYCAKSTICAAAEQFEEAARAAE